MLAHLHRHLRDAGQRLAVAPVERRQVADDEDVRRARNREVRLDVHPPRAIERHAERGAERRRRHAGGPQHGLRANRLAADRHPPGDDVGDQDSVRTSTPSRSSPPSRPRRAASRERRLRIDGPPSSRMMRAELGIDVPEVAGERLPRHLGERARHLDAGRAAADHDERQERGAGAPVGLALGALERQQHPPPDLERILERLQARRGACATRRGRNRRASRRSRRSGSRSSISPSVRMSRLAARSIAGGLGEQHLDVALPPQDPADRRGDVPRRQRRHRDLIQQRLEDMMVAPIDQRDPHRRAAQRPRGIQAAETAADDHDMRHASYDTLLSESREAAAGASEPSATLGGHLADLQQRRRIWPLRITSPVGAPRGCHGGSPARFLFWGWRSPPPRS